MVCAPGRAHQRLTPSNCDALLFDDVMWVETCQARPFRFRAEDARPRHRRRRDAQSAHRDRRDPRGARNGSSTTRSIPDQVGLGLVDEIRSYLDGLSDRDLAETLIGGLSTEEFPETDRRRRCWAWSRRRRASPNICCRRCRTRSIRATPPAGSMAAAPSTRSTGRRGMRKPSSPRRSTSSTRTSPAR